MGIDKKPTLRTGKPKSKKPTSLNWWASLYN